jgi:leader peptidase (prepilin peptidase)/N-methyltransferase
MFLYIDFLAVLFMGLILGSFASALIYRIPNDISWVKSKDSNKGFERSFCPSCNKKLQIKDLVPLFSWLLLKGECRYCSEPISKRYPIIEGLSLLACLGIYFTMGLSIKGMLLMAMVPFLISLLFIDLDFKILPNQLLIILAFLAALLLVYQGVFIIKPYDLGAFALDVILGALIYSGLVYLIGVTAKKILRKETLGFGDVKFFALAGALLGLSNISSFFIVSGFLGIILGLYWKIIKKDEYFPFGPALILSLYVNILMIS